jgi:Transposase DDE domain group 1
MTVCNSHPMLFPSFEGLKVEGSFEGGDVSSDGGVQLLRLADRRLGLSAALAKVLPDPRDPLKVEHPVRDLLRQRIYGLACGYEDLNDHDTLREDLCWQSAVERTRALASSPTLCRLEARADRAAARPPASLPFPLRLLGVGDAWGARRAVHRQPRAAAGGAGARFRRDR